MKIKEPCAGFELGSPGPFPITISITQQVPLIKSSVRAKEKKQVAFYLKKKWVLLSNPIFLQDDIIQGCIK